MVNPLLQQSYNNVTYWWIRFWSHGGHHATLDTLNISADLQGSLFRAQVHRTHTQSGSRLYIVTYSIERCPLVWNYSVGKIKSHEYMKFRTHDYVSHMYTPVCVCVCLHVHVCACVCVCVQVLFALVTLPYRKSCKWQQLWLQAICESAELVLTESINIYAISLVTLCSSRCHNNSACLPHSTYNRMLDTFHAISLIWDCLPLHALPLPAIDTSNNGQLHPINTPWQVGMSELLSRWKWV